MSLSAAASGFLVFLLSLSVMQAQDSWRVTYASTEIIAFKGSTVDLNCNYMHPSGTRAHDAKVVQAFWFASHGDSETVDLTKVLQHSGRVEYHLHDRDCTLTIRDLRESDAAAYKFRYVRDGMVFTGLPGVQVKVKDGLKGELESVSPPGEIREGSSVTLGCSIEADPAAKYTWNKMNARSPPLSEGRQLVLRSVRPSDSGDYYCTAEDGQGKRVYRHISIDFKYAPQFPSVSASPSAEILQGGSVTLTCSSDANPAANYTWYKLNQDLPKSSGATFVMADCTAEHSGIYYCEAQNTRGRHRNTLRLTVGEGNSTFIINVVRLILMVLMLTPLLSFSLWMRKKKPVSATSERREPAERGKVRLRSFACHVYENASNLLTAAQTEETEEQEDEI